MAFDSYDVEWHLTPNGWFSGDTWYFGKKDSGVAAPTNRLLTTRKSVRQRSEWSKEDTSWRETWRADSATDAEIQALMQEYPRPK